MKKVAPVRPDYDKANYDISRIAPYKLEDPLTFLDGSRVQGPADWEKRRQEILSIFASEMFGREPPLPQVLITEKVEEKDGALAGFAVRSQYKMYFKEDNYEKTDYFDNFCAVYGAFRSLRRRDDDRGSQTDDFGCYACRQNGDL